MKPERQKRKPTDARPSNPPVGSDPEPPKIALPTAAELDDDRYQPWSKRICESQRAYSAFWCYLSLPPLDRSIRKALAASGTPDSHVRTWERWSSEFCWQRRTEAYDEYQNRREEIRRCRLREALDDADGADIDFWQTIKQVAQKKLLQLSPDDLHLDQALKLRAKAVTEIKELLGPAYSPESLNKSLTKWYNSLGVDADFETELRYGMSVAKWRDQGRLLKLEMDNDPETAGEPPVNHRSNTDKSASSPPKPSSPAPPPVKPAPPKPSSPTKPAARPRPNSDKAPPPMPEPAIPQPVSYRERKRAW